MRGADFVNFKQLTRFFKSLEFTHAHTHTNTNIYGCVYQLLLTEFTVLKATLIVFIFLLNVCNYKMIFYVTKLSIQ